MNLPPHQEHPQVVDHERPRANNISSAKKPRIRLLAQTALLLLISGAVVFLQPWQQQELLPQNTLEIVAHEDRAITAGRASIEAHNSPSLAQAPTDPDNLVVASKIDSPRYDAALHISSDGGGSWSRVAFPAPARADRPYAPDLAWSSDGSLYLVFVTLTGRGNNPEAVWLSSSKDAGKSWSNPKRILGAYAFQVRIALDRSNGDLYVTWLQANEHALGTLSFTETGLPILATTSRDDGVTWSDPARVSAPERDRVGAAVPVVGPSGRLYVLFYDFKDDRFDWENLEGSTYQGSFELVIARSEPGRLDFEEHLVDPAVAPVGRFLPYLPTFANISIDPSTEALYAVWQDARGGDWDVLLRSSTDGGTTWSQPVLVNPASAGDQYMPTVAAAGDGRIDVLYLERGVARHGGLTNAYVASSYDAGSTSSRVRLSRVGFSSRIGLETVAGEVDQGTRLGLISRENLAHAVWTDARRGTQSSGKLDIFFATISLLQN